MEDNYFFHLPGVSVNLHLTNKCNMICKGCFGNFTDNINLGINEWEKIIWNIYEGTKVFQKRKISFAGGEPFLYPNLKKLIEYSKQLGFTTSIITNGSLITEEVLAELNGSVDWIGLSIDSLNIKTNKELGRIVKVKPFGIQEYSARCNLIRKCGYKLKVNTVISKENCHEDMHKFISDIKPDRWKVLRRIKVKGENDGYSNYPTDLEFKSFVGNHIDIQNMFVVSVN